uniref:Uncharacterized protein n=1 Tax=Molossus molossus TaxID=27622 RepID=A0A7J8F9N7_MOLMO|nr:hypothetical protein HJG59_008575 [Molossus molossus]
MPSDPQMESQEQAPISFQVGEPELLPATLFLWSLGPCNPGLGCQRQLLRRSSPRGLQPDPLSQAAAPAEPRRRAWCGGDQGCHLAGARRRRRGCPEPGQGGESSRVCGSSAGPWRPRTSVQTSVRAV